MHNNGDKMSRIPALKLIGTATAVAAICSGCGGSSTQSAIPSPVQLAASCSNFAATALAGTSAVIKSAVLNGATTTTPQNCQIDGEINHRVGVDGQIYGIKFRLRLPTSNWNGRFYMGGGGGTNGTLIDPVARVAQGYATIGTDSGHDNLVDNAVNAGGTGSFGVDPQARVDFAYNSYDQVTQIGKELVKRFYAQPAAYSYYEGCSEGGREGMLMSQRFPAYYDGIVAGDPVFHLPLGPLSGVYTTQLFAGLAKRSSLSLASGAPAIVNTYSDPDLLLVRNAVLDACDKLDGLADGIVDNQPACTNDLVKAKLAAIQCTGTKNASCLSADQIGTLQTAFAGAVNSQGTQLYSDWPWDGGIGGQAGTTYNQSWRSWWLGTYGSATNNATKLTFSTPLAVAYTTPPVLPISVADSLAYSLGYNFDTEPQKLYAVAGIYSKSAAELYFTDATDLSSFRERGSKMMMYQGGSDPAISTNDILKWYKAMNAKMGSQAQSFARMFVVPGMNHCSGGPSTDSFDMLPQLVNWVEKGVAPDAVIAKASNPAYFNVAARTRPLCPYPKQARYSGTGDINDASNFSCQ
jgi:feruloyl esterase